jgi:hypothetical protein
MGVTGPPVWHRAYNTVQTFTAHRMAFVRVILHTVGMQSVR